MKGRDGGREEKERRGEGTGTDSQTVSLLFDMCCCGPPMQTGVEP